MDRPPVTTHLELVGVLPNLACGLAFLVGGFLFMSYLAVRLFGPVLLDPQRMEMRRIQNGPGWGEDEEKEYILRRLALIGRCFGIPFGLWAAWPYFTAAWDAL